MKLIMTGVTGFLGREMLLECLATPSITSIVALSRRELDIANSKLDLHVMKDEDFLHYSDSSFTEKLKGAKACIARDHTFERNG